MEIWLDTTDTTVIESAKSLGILYGVTTNPKLLSEANLPREKTIEQLLAKQDGPVAVQVTGEEADDMVQEGEFWNAFSHRIVIKVPVTAQGLLAMHRLARQGIAIMATTVFEPYQALLAMQAGASYLAIYHGRISDNRKNPSDILKAIQAIKTNYKYETKILVASIRSVNVVNAAAELGLDAVTLNDAVFEELMSAHPDVDRVLQEFAEATQLAVR